MVFMFRRHHISLISSLKGFRGAIFFEFHSSLNVRPTDYKTKGVLCISCIWRTTTKTVFANGWIAFSHAVGRYACARRSAKITIFACGRCNRMQKSDFRMLMLKPAACKNEKSQKKNKNPQKKTLALGARARRCRSPPCRIRRARARRRRRRLGQVVVAAPELATVVVAEVVAAVPPPRSSSPSPPAAVNVAKVVVAARRSSSLHPCRIRRPRARHRRGELVVTSGESAGAGSAWKEGGRPRICSGEGYSPKIRSGRLRPPCASSQAHRRRLSSPRQPPLEPHAVGLSSPVAPPLPQHGCEKRI